MDEASDYWVDYTPFFLALSNAMRVRLLLEQADPHFFLESLGVERLLQP
jgi:hypothetical protein